MPGFTPNEGEAAINDILFANTTRTANMTLVLFTNSSPDETINAAGLTQPSGGGYSTVTLADATWSHAADVATYAEQTFSFTGTVTGSVQGYAILATVGGTSRLLWIEVDDNGPYAFVDGSSYAVTPSITTA